MSAGRGQVYAHVGQSFTRTEYDVVVLGAGRMGSLCAHFLYTHFLLQRGAAQQAAGLRVLLLDSGGLPNEEGASLLAPGLWTAFDVPTERRAQAELTRALALGELPIEEGGLPPAPREPAPQIRNLIELLPAPTGHLANSEWPNRAWPNSALQPISELAAAFPETQPLIDWQAAHTQTPYWRRDPAALTYNVAALTTRAAQQAIAAGADLMLNARAYPTAQGIKIERLTVTNTHEIVVHETCHLSARQVVIAAGAAGPLLAEQHLGQVTHHAQVYQQFPRLHTTDTISTTDQSALVRLGTLTLRPYAQGYTVLAPMPHPDPYGYLPTGGRLSGVPVGVRREGLQAILEAMPVLSVLASAALQVGHSLSDVAGAWRAWPVGGWPLQQRLTERHTLLLGGPRADLTGAALAREAALEALAGLSRVDTKP